MHEGQQLLRLGRRRFETSALTRVPHSSDLALVTEGSRGWRPSRTLPERSSSRPSSEWASVVVRPGPPSLGMWLSAGTTGLHRPAETYCVDAKSLGMSATATMPSGA